MIEVRLFAYFRDGRGKTLMLSSDDCKTVYDISQKLGIETKDISICLINGFHSKPESVVSDGDIVALFPPVGGG